MKLKEIERTAMLSWSPAPHHPICLASGTSAQQLDASFGTSAALEFFELNLGKPSLEMNTCGSLPTSQRYHRLVWSPFGSEAQTLPRGVLVAGGENGNVLLYDPAKVMAGDADAVIAESDRHTGPVRALDINPFQTNLVASGGNESEIYIWDLKNFGSPMTPGPKTQPLEDVSCVAWNKQVQHILASCGPGGRTSVWDLRKNQLIIKVGDHSSRMHCSGMAWHPEVATQLVVASEDDRMPVVQMWDLRFAASPLKIFEKHTRGILAIAWSSADPELLLSCGKDSRIVCWNPNTAEVIYELPTGNQWCFDIQWCPRNPAVFSAAGFDGYVNIYSITGGTSQAPSQRQDQISNSFSSMDPFGTGQTLPPLELPQSAAPTAPTPLKKPPRWTRTPAGASFAFGGKLLTLDTASPNPQKSLPVHVSQVVTESALLLRSAQLQATLHSGQFMQFCQEKIDSTMNEFEKTVWSFLKANFDSDSRARFLELLGYNKEDLALKISAALTEKPAEVENPTPCFAHPAHNANTFSAADSPEAVFDLMSAEALKPAATRELLFTPSVETTETQERLFTPSMETTETQERLFTPSVETTETRERLFTPSVETTETQERLFTPSMETTETLALDGSPAAVFDSIAAENMEPTSAPAEPPAPPVTSEDTVEVNDDDAAALVQGGADEKEGQQQDQWDEEDVILEEEPTEPAQDILAPFEDVLRVPSGEALQDAAADVCQAPPGDGLQDSSVDELQIPSEETLDLPSAEVLQVPFEDEPQNPSLQVPLEETFHHPGLEVLRDPPEDALQDPSVDVCQGPPEDALQVPSLEVPVVAFEETLHDSSLDLCQSSLEETLQEPSAEVPQPPCEDEPQNPTLEVLQVPFGETLDHPSVEVFPALPEEPQQDPRVEIAPLEAPQDPTVEVTPLEAPQGPRVDLVQAVEPHMNDEVVLEDPEESPSQMIAPAENSSLCNSKGVDALITQALLTGDFEAAVELCLHDNRMADGIILALAGGTELLQKTQRRYLQKSQSKLNKLFSAVVMKDVRDILGTCELQNWKEALAAAMTYAQPSEFFSLCDSLGDRLEAANDAQLRAQACICYICAGNVEKLVSCWTKAQEGNSPLVLQDLVEKVVVLQHAVEQTQNSAPTEMGLLLAKNMSAYANLLASQGCLSTALQYLPDQTDPLRERVAKALGQQETAAQPPPSEEPPAVAQLENPSPAVQPSTSPPAPLQPSTSPPAPLQFYQPVRAASTVTSWSNQTPTALPHPPTALPHPPAALPHPPAALPHPPTPLSHLPTPLSHLPMPLSSGATADQAKAEPLNPAYGMPGASTAAPPAVPLMYSHQYQRAQNGWNDPPTVMRAPKKKQVPEHYAPPAPITAPIMAPLGVEPQSPSGPPHFPVLQAPHSNVPPLQPSAPPTANAAPDTAAPKARPEGPPGAPTGDVIQPQKSVPAEKISKKPIPSEHLVLKSTFEGLIQRCLAVANDPQTRRKLDDANKRLEVLYDKLREQTLSPAIVGGLHTMARSVESRCYSEGLSVHTHIVSSSNFSEISGFMPVLKVVLTQANRLGV